MNNCKEKYAGGQWKKVERPSYEIEQLERMCDFSLKKGEE